MGKKCVLIVDPFNRFDVVSERSWFAPLTVAARAYNAPPRVPPQEILEWEAPRALLVLQDIARREQQVRGGPQPRRHQTQHRQPPGVGIRVVRGRAPVTP